MNAPEHRTRPSMDAMKLARDGYLQRPNPVPLWTDERDPETGHVFRTFTGIGGTLEYAPKGCQCGRCAR